MIVGFLGAGDTRLNVVSEKRSPHLNVGYSGMATFLHLKHVSSSASHIQAC